MKIKIVNKEYDVKVMQTEEEKEKGLQNVQSLPEDEGMIFMYEKSEDVGYWMEDTFIALDIIFINDDYEVISVAKGEPESKTPHFEKHVKYVLELNIDSGVKEGDELEFSDDKKSNSKMLVLDPDGNTQMQLDGGERIFSRKNTKTLIKMANKAHRTEKDSAYISLGNKVFKFLEVQNSNKPEYVDTPKEK